jgi:DinB family
VKVLDFRGLFRAPAYTFIQSGLAHTIHHRGQLSTYLRPMGSRVPAIYGESYDSAEAKKAAQPQAIARRRSDMTSRTSTAVSDGGLSHPAVPWSN